MEPKNKMAKLDNKIIDEMDYEDIREDEERHRYLEIDYIKDF